jgi:hypothetical protein
MRTRSVAAITLVLLLAGCASPAVTPVTDEETATATITGGLDTDPVDNGRPVVLIAAALGVPTEVFREAFSGVSPAGAGEDVDEARAQSNKAALLSVLGPYGITNDQLDAASNFYRYNGSAGEMWPHEAATATYSDGVFTITNPGYGYSSAPTITLSTGQTATATLAYGTDTATNGSITAITLD